MTVAPRPRPRVVIVGAGFGGLNAARALRRADVDITIVDERNYHTFQPLLYQVATAGLNAADVAHAVRGIFQDQRNVAFRRGRVVGAEWERRQLLVQHDEGETTTLPFDHLVVAAGSTRNFFGVEGAADHALPLYSLPEAVALRNHLLGRFEAADADPRQIDDGALTFAIVGGGPTGVEMAGALRELVDVVLRKDFHDLDLGRVRVVLLDMASELLTAYGPAARRHALETLRGRGVEVRLGETVAAVTPTRVTLGSGEELRAHTLVWAAGVRAASLAEVLGVERGPGGRIVVDETLAVPGHPGVYAVGDVAHIVDRRHGVLPQLAPVAIQGGRHVARTITRQLAGRPRRRFRYVDKGTMATIGRRAAVAELPLGISLSGTLAWLAWLGLHIVQLIGFRNRASVLLNWTWNYVTWDRGPRLILESAARRAAPCATPPGGPTTPR
jgi:NADH dehydrogenase